MPRTRNVGGAIRVPDEWPGFTGEFVVIEKDISGSVISAEIGMFVRHPEWRGSFDVPSTGWWYSLATELDSFGDRAEWVGRK